MSLLWCIQIEVRVCFGGRDAWTAWMVCGQTEGLTESFAKGPWQLLLPCYFVLGSQWSGLQKYVLTCLNLVLVTVLVAVCAVQIVCQ